MKNFVLQSRNFRFWAAAVVLAFVLLVLGAYFFPWDILRVPINRYVSERLGRQFEITRHLSVHPGFTATVRAEELQIANPDWAQERYLLKASAAEFDIKILPLLFGKIVLPRISLTGPTVGLQIDPDGRRTWALSKDTSSKGAVPEIGSLLVDRGTVNYVAKGQGADLHVEFSLARESGIELPLEYKAGGKWKGQPFTASGHAGGLLQFSKDTRAPFPIEVTAAAGRTSLKAKGSIAGLVDLSGIDASFELQGQSLDDLYQLLGVVMPHTPPYKFRGKLDKKEKLWSVSDIQGTLGKTDLSGALSFDQSAAAPLLTGKIQSKVLDFADLGPVIGMTPETVPRSGNKKPNLTTSRPAASRVVKEKVAPTSRQVKGKVLPVATLDVAKLKSMNADVVYSVGDIRHVKALPLDKGSVHVKLNAGVLQLDPISLGVAGGTVAGIIRIDSNTAPPAIVTKLAVRGVQLNRLFPSIESTKSALGKVGGQFDLTGRGNSMAQMLGSASGNMAVLVGRGEISNILLEFIGLDGGEVIKFLVRGDRNVQLQCAALAFDVKQGLMSSRAIVMDTSDTVVSGEGTVSLADETLNILLKAAPKDRSILSFRSPLRIAGTFGSPTAGPEKVALAGRVGLALLLGAINPFLGLAATIETGPGKDADCAAVLTRSAPPKPATAPARK